MARVSEPEGGSEKMIRALCVLVGVLAAIAPLAAQTVTIDVEDATVQDVVTALKELTGAQIVGEVHARQDTPLVTLQFEDAPLKRVIAELCKQVGWHYSRLGRGYHLLPGVEEDHRPRFEVEGYQIFLDSISLRNTHSLNLKPREREVQSDHCLYVELKAEAESDEMLDPVVGFDTAITATLDTGDVVKGPEQPLHSSRRYSFEPEIHASVPVDRPPPGAKSIASLEGDLVLYADIRETTLEFPVDEVNTTKDEEVLSVTFVEYDPKGQQAEFELVLPEDELRTEEGPRAQPWCKAVLVAEDGARLLSNGSDWTGNVEEGLAKYKQGFRFPSVPDGFEPVKVIYTATISRDPSRRLHYRFENIPLPIPGGDG
jgi:hypothetical protein